MRFYVRRDRPQAECHIMDDDIQKAVMYNAERNNFNLSKWIPDTEYKFIEKIDFEEVQFLFPHLTMNWIKDQFKYLFTL